MQTQFFDMYRAGLKSAADMMSSSLATAQRLQQQQLDALNSVLTDQVKSVQQLAEVRSVEEFIALQTRLTGAQMERMMDLWNRWLRMAGENQMALMSHAQGQVGQVRDAAVAIREAAQEQQRKTA